METLKRTGGSGDDPRALREEWLGRLSDLSDAVKGWAEERDWSTRRLAKKMRDSRLGPYEAPALLMQKGTTRVLLDPVARFAPGVEGVVDLYLMPAYDDIARLDLVGGEWRVHRVYPGTPAPAESGPRPLSGDALGRILDEMVAHAAESL